MLEEQHLTELKKIESVLTILEREPTPRWPSPNSMNRKNALVAADLLNDRVLPVSPHKSSPGSSLAISPYPASWREPTSRMRLHHTFATHLAVRQISA
jgi:hypothetical protein